MERRGAICKDDARGTSAGIIAGAIVWIGHAFVPTMETSIASLATVFVGLISGFIEASPKVTPDSNE